MLDPQEAANKLYPLDHEVEDPEGETGVARSDPYGYDELANRAFVEGARFEREQIIVFIERLKKVEQESNPHGATEKSMSSYVIGELDGILHVLELRNGTGSEQVQDEIGDLPGEEGRLRT